MLLKIIFDKEKWTQAINAVKVGIIVGSPNIHNSLFEMINQEVSNMYGYSQEELIGKPLALVFSEEAKKNLPIMIKQVHSMGNYSFESIHVRKNGTRFPVRISSTAIKNAEGEIINRIAIVEDITKQKLLEKTMNESKVTNNIIFDQSPIAKELYDASGHLIRVNQVCLQLFGILHQDEIRGFNLFTDPNVSTEIKTKLLNKESARYETIFDFELIKQNNLYQTSKSGKIVLDNLISPLIDNNILFGYLVQIQDITERKLLEKSLIEKERLSATGELAAGVAHDINNTLQIILGNLELTLLEDNSNLAVEYLQIIKKAVIDASDRVKKLQHFAGIKNGKNNHIRPIDINMLISDVIEQAKPLWQAEKEKNGIVIKILTNFNEIPTVDGHLEEFRTAFFNIVKNAIEAMPQGGTLSFITKKITTGISILIQDTGMGMTENTQKRIFQPFFTTKGFEIGRGLGMSNVYAIIKEHNGTITIKESIIGKGTTFEIIFPKGIVTATPTISSAIVPLPQSYKILIVDDNDSIRVVEQKQLEALGHIVSCSNSAKLALELLKINKYDLIITDIGMPEMNGWQFAEQIKLNYPSQKIVVLSGWNYNISDDEKNKYGVSLVLSKPLDFKQLNQTLRTLFDMEAK